MIQVNNELCFRRQIEELEKEVLISPLSWSVNSKGRQVYEEESDMRTCYMRDRDRILHSKSFRRMKHKTQVFISPEGDHYRTRLTHTLEVAQIARTAARVLRLNEDLTEAIALGHDLGHTPFGHAGERVLNELSPHGFSHAAQSVRVVEKLEHHHDGLNLTYEVRDGILYHTMGGENDFSSSLPATAEAVVVRFADKIAYINHDIDDALRGRIITQDDLPAEALKLHGYSVKDRINTMIHDLIATSRQNILKNGLSPSQIAMSPAIEEALTLLKMNLYDTVYFGSEAKREEGKAEQLVRSLYLYFKENPNQIPDEYMLSLKDGEDLDTVLCDYISSMSDTYAMHLYQKLFIPESWKN